MARSGRKVTAGEVVNVSLNALLIPKGTEGCIGEFLPEIAGRIDEGNIVQMGDLGNFRMSIKTGTPTDTAKKFMHCALIQAKVLFLSGQIAGCVRHWIIHC